MPIALRAVWAAFVSRGFSGHLLLCRQYVSLLGPEKLVFLALCSYMSQIKVLPIEKHSDETLLSDPGYRNKVCDLRKMTCFYIWDWGLGYTWRCSGVSPGSA